MSMNPVARADPQIPIPFNVHLTEIPEKNATRLRYKVLAWNVVSKICTVALIAITAVVLSVALGMFTLTGSMPLFLLLIVFISVPLHLINPKLQKITQDTRHLFGREKGVADELKEISHWSTLEIEQFLVEQELSKDDLPMDRLRDLNEIEPLRALLPVIARFRIFVKDANSNFNIADQLLNLPPPPPNQKREEREETRLQRLQSRNTGWNRQEVLAIPAALNAALMLQIIQNPFVQFRNIDEAGYLSPRTCEDRFFDLTFEQNNDYFLPYEGSPAKAVDYGNIMQDPTPKTLRAKLFPPPEILV